MNFRVIRYFVDSAKNQSFSEAALRNHVSLPAISQAIKRLEQELGFSLFVHGKNRFALTAAGKEFLPEAEKILSSWQELKSGNVQSSVVKRAKETLSLAAPSSLYSSILIQDLAQICIQQEYNLRLFTGSSRSIRKFLEDRSCDFAICLDDPFLRGFASKSLRKGRFGLYQNESCSNQPALIVGDFGLEVNQLSTFYQKKYGKALPVVAEVASWDLIAQLVEHGAGQGLLPDFHKTTFRNGIHRVFRHFPQAEYEIKIYAHATSSNRLFHFLADRLSGSFAKLDRTKNSKPK